VKKALILSSLALAAIIAASCGQASATSESSLTGTVKTGGSTSVEKVMTALIYQFQEMNQGATINYEMNGSGDGIKNTASGLYEIGHSSRALKTDGTEDGLTASAYAIDGIAVILNSENSVNDLTTEQIRGIYTGTIKNWSEVGGSDALITVATREAGSGTRDAFCEIAGIEEIIPEATTCDSTGAVQTTISQNANAIGYISFSDADPSKVKLIGYNGVAVSEGTLKDGSYALKREFYLVTKTDAELSPLAKAFFDYVFSADGQKIVVDNKLLQVQ
jgi:phosphate transport system substrate-binding protein